LERQNVRRPVQMVFVNKKFLKMRLRKSAKRKLRQIPGAALVPGFFADIMIIDRNTSNRMRLRTQNKSELRLRA